MGQHQYLNDQDIVKYQKVNLDKEVDEVFQRAKELDRSLLIYDYPAITKVSFFGKRTIETHYGIGHQQYLPNGKPAMEMRIQQCALGNKRVLMAYLYGIINGILKDQLNK